MESLTAPKGKGNTRVRMDLLCTQCDRPGVLARGLCPTHYSYWHRETKGRKPVRIPKACAFCSHPFEASMPKTVYCSEACAQRDRSGWSKSKEVALWVEPFKYPQRRPKVVHVRTANRWQCGACSVCGSYFVGWLGSMSCSTACDDKRIKEARNRAWHRRRALKKSAFIAPVYRKKVFQADGYRCHICMKLTKRDAVVPHPKAPTLDHLIPLSLGGTHEPRNCRTACFRCNSVKGDRLAGDQLILFNM